MPYDTNPPPQKPTVIPPENIAAPMVEEMKALLKRSKNKSRLTQLEEHAALLDTIFRRFICAAENPYHRQNQTDATETAFNYMPKFDHYAAAFKAQELFCRTARAIETIEEKQQLRAYKKARRVKQTEGILPPPRPKKEE